MKEQNSININSISSNTSGSERTKDFNTFMSQLQTTNQTLDFFCDFNKISQNVENIKLSLCMLNSLIGSTDMRRSVEAIWNRDKSAFDALDILVAVRRERTKKGERKVRYVLSSDGSTKNMDEYYKSVDGILEFLHGTGLYDIFVESRIKDLVDYVFGIETGLDSNARKNRGGHIMENTVHEIFENASIAHRQEVYSVEWPSITKALGTDKKRFDFVIKTYSKTYLIEVNFYSGPGGGSKLNEIARAYSDLAPKINAVTGFEFVWITDGGGWCSARNKLQEAYNIIPSIYNLTDITDFIERIKNDA